jgi:UDPglucose 6-dehydrogenase
MTNIAIVGHGFVGKAVDFGFPSSKTLKKWIVDPATSKYKSLFDVKADLDFVFVCVPTPMGSDGSIDSSIVLRVLEDCWNAGHHPIVVLKSTVTPDIIKKIDRPARKLVYNPEFLRERSANQDFVNPDFHVFGGSSEHTLAVERLYHKHSICRSCRTFHVTTEEASFIKYGINTFLASKVAWMNQFYDVIEKTDSSFQQVIDVITTDPRVGVSHTSVPGFDGKRGFSGACFTKDTAAFAKYADSRFTILNEAIRYNQRIRSQYELDDREIAQKVRFDIQLEDKHDL